MLTFKEVIASSKYLAAIRGGARRRTRRRTRLDGLTAFESLENRMLLTVLGTDPLIFDPTPVNASSGDEVDIGEIKYELVNTSDIKVTYSIDVTFQAVYDLSAVETKIIGGTLGSATDLGGTESSIHTLSLASYLPLSVLSLDIDACATIDKRDVGTVGAALPTVGTVSVNTNGNMTGVPSYFDTILTPGRIPTSTNTTDDTVTFASDPGWATGAAVRVVQGYTTALTDTGLVTPPTATDTTKSETYFVRNVEGFTYSFHTSYNDAVAAINPQNITNSLPTTGEIIIAGENEALAFLGQTPINESVVPTSTKTTLTTSSPLAVSSFNGTNEQIVVADTTGLANGDRVRVSAAFGGLTTTTAAWVRVVTPGVAGTVELYNSYAAAFNTLGTSGRIPLSGTGLQSPPIGTTLNTVDPDDETVTFTSDPKWDTGTPVRVSATGGGLSGGTTYFARSLSGGVYSFFDTQAHASDATPGVDPLLGRKDLTEPITASVFANLTTVSFENDHNWATGTVVRVAASVGGLEVAKIYYVGISDSDKDTTRISLHTSLANAKNNISPVTFTAPITALVTPMFDGWCVDNDRLIGGGEYIANFFSSYETSSFPDTTEHPKDKFGTDAGLRPSNTSATPSLTDSTLDRVTFIANHNWATQQAVRVTATDAGLSAGTTYYIRSTSVNSVSFHPTAAAANNQGPVPASTIFANTGLIPSATNSTANVETVSFAVAHAWETGDVVRVSVSGGNLTVGANNFVRFVDANTISLYDTAANAISGGPTGLRDLSAAIMATVYKVDLVSTEDTVTFASGHGFATGDIVTPTSLGGGLTSGTAYTLYNVSGDTFSFHTASPTPDNKVNLTANITTSINERVDLTAAISPTTIVFRAESIDFAVTTNWPNGTKVRIDVGNDGIFIDREDAGLMEGTNYYVRQQNVVGGAADANSISFYTTREYAQAGGTIGLITLTDPMATTTKVYVPENLVENPENLDVMNWVLNQNFQSQLAAGQAPTATNIANTTQVPASTIFANTGLIPSATNSTAGVETVSFAVAHAWETGDVVQVSVSGGGLTAGSNYYIRNLGGGSYSFYNSATNANAGGPTGRINLTADITADVFTPSLVSTEDTVTFASGHGFVMGSVVNVTAAGGGLSASTTYYLYNFSGDIFSFHTAAAATAANKVNLTAAITAGVYLQSDDTVTMTASPNYGWTTGLRVQVSAAGTDYYIRAISTTTLAFYATAADASNNVNRIDLTAAIEPSVVRPYYTEGDVQRTVWELIENNPGDPGHSQTRVNEIMALADAAVGLNDANVTFVPDCGGTVAVIIQPFEVDEGSNNQITIAQITIAQIPNYCATAINCQTLTVKLGSISGMKFEDMNGDGDNEEGGDPGLDDWTIFLDGDKNELLDWKDAGIMNGVWDAGEGEQWTKTAPGGSYSFTNLLPGTYSVREVQQDGWVQTKGVGSVTLAITPDRNENTTTANVTSLTDELFGNFELFDLSGVKVWDIDRDGAIGDISDLGDQRLEGLRVYLDTIDNNQFDYDDVNDNQVFDLGDKALELFATTDDNGAYSFTNLGPGTYDVREDLSSLDSAEWQPTAGTPLFHTVTATSGKDATANFYNHKFTLGEYRSYSQGGYQGTGAPGQYLLANFNTAFGNGLVIPRSGTVGDIVLRTGAEVQAFLKANFKNKFTNDTVANYVPSNLETQFVALSLSVRFDAYDENFSTGTANLGDLKLCNLESTYGAGYAKVDDLTVSQYLAQVAYYLDGSSSYTLGLLPGELTYLLNKITLGFDAGEVTSWAEMYLC